MTVPAGATPIQMDLHSIGSGLVEVGRGIAGIWAVSLQSLADFLSVIIHNPGPTAAGIVVGLVLAALAWCVALVVLRLRTSERRRQAQQGSAAPRQKTDLQTLPLEQVEKQLDSSPDGLTAVEAAKRLVQYGTNEIEEEKTNVILLFLK